MEKLSDAKVEDLAGIYKEIAEIIGLENAYKVFDHFKGLQMMFPLKFYSSNYIAYRISKEYNGKNIRHLARKYERSESRVRQILRKRKL